MNSGSDLYRNSHSSKLLYKEMVCPFIESKATGKKVTEV